MTFLGNFASYGHIIRCTIRDIHGTWYSLPVVQGTAVNCASTTVDTTILFRFITRLCFVRPTEGFSIAHIIARQTYASHNTSDNPSLHSTSAMDLLGDLGAADQLTAGEQAQS